jgi:hypothetical protein
MSLRCGYDEPFRSKSGVNTPGDRLRHRIAADELFLAQLSSDQSFFFSDQAAKHSASDPPLLGEVIDWKVRFEGGIW